MPLHDRWFLGVLFSCALLTLVLLGVMLARSHAQPPARLEFQSDRDICNRYCDGVEGTLVTIMRPMSASAQPACVCAIYP